CAGEPDPARPRETCRRHLRPYGFGKRKLSRTETAKLATAPRRNYAQSKQPLGMSANNRNWRSHFFLRDRFPLRHLSIVAALAVCAVAVSIAQTKPSGLSVRSADPVHYLQDIKTLTQPSMEGRGDGTKGLTLAADFLQQQYKQAGLEPAGTNGYFQPFQL